MSAPVYHQRGATFRDTFTYLAADGTPVTGKSAWTTQLEKDGANQAVTGLTITEVSAVNNPGLYAYTLDGSTGPCTTNGSYNLRIIDTTDTTRVWEQQIIVNTGGSFSTAGVTFTATAGHGRAMAGGSPLAGASVAVLSGSTVIASTVTDGYGLWGPLYFNTDGTYVVTVQQIGYASATGSLVISGGATIATGPSTDLTLTQVTSNPLSASELWAYFTRQARDVGGVKATTERQQGVQDALDMLAKECQWNWLLRRGFLSLHGAVTMTVNLTQGSATVTTSGTFPIWAGPNARAFFQSQVVEILTRDSDTQITLAAPWVKASASVSMIILQDEYPLPDNTLWFHQLIPYQRWAWGGSPQSPETFFQRQSAMMYGQQFANCWCVHAGSLCLYPYPSQDAELAFTYYTKPAQLTSGADIADWDPAQIEVLRRAIDVQVVNRYGSCAGGDEAAVIRRYQKALALARTTDREPTAAGNALEEMDAWDERLGRTWRQRPRG